MLYFGEAYVPPSCPARETGEAGDVEHMEFLHDAHAMVAQTEVGVQFYKCDAEDEADWSTVATHVLWASKSEVAKRALLVQDGPQAEAMRSRFRDILCNRVANCHGVINGECWALGETALIEVYGQVVTEFEPSE